MDSLQQHDGVGSHRQKLSAQFETRPISVNFIVGARSFKNLFLAKFLNYFYNFVSFLQIFCILLSFLYAKLSANISFPNEMPHMHDIIGIKDMVSMSPSKSLSRPIALDKASNGKISVLQRRNLFTICHNTPQAKKKRKLSDTYSRFKSSEAENNLGHKMRSVTFEIS